MKWIWRVNGFIFAPMWVVYAFIGFFPLWLCALMFSVCVIGALPLYLQRDGAS